MDLNIPDIGFSGLTAFVVFVTTVIGFIKGMVRMLLSLIALLLGLLGAYWGFSRGGAMLGDFFPTVPSWLPAVTGVVVGFALFLVTRILLKTLLKPIKLKDGKRKNLGGLGGLIGIGTGCIIAFFSLSSLRYLGTVAEVNRLDSAIGDKAIKEDVPVSPFITIKNLIDGCKPGQLHAKIDFFNDAPTAQLAKLKVLVQEQHAINLSAGGNISVHKVLSQPDVQKILATTADLELVYIDEKRWGHLLSSERLKKVAKIPEARELLLLAEIEESLKIAPPPLFPEPEESEDEETKTAKK